MPLDVGNQGMNVALQGDDHARVNAPIRCATLIPLGQLANRSVFRGQRHLAYLP
eukprot:CAMPEP_0197907256 /NCGR_PEP_ID=MMETSP1439-20131203/64445_1 /TAXON_ID=66791 /ORGANISM="Gonyaulax spinifera, Strain CCMP409" /LENGTH=53 /DNA_ID=CAMNT_0043528675 /DNA_START=137 /DNA_END=295 /DNA_ORIENTATION=+